MKPIDCGLLSHLQHTSTAKSRWACMIKYLVIITWWSLHIKSSWWYLLLVFKYNFYFILGVVVLQCCVSFLCTEKWICYTHTHTFFFSIFSHIGYYRILSKIPIVFESYLFRTETILIYPWFYGPVLFFLDTMALVPTRTSSHKLLIWQLWL